ncbi:AAA family ATPase [Streptomyces smyrnaeus]|uniref:AAA family ATPase n=1 Tax=Streptomyces smyrnaeus TaxID=1387713 RepID=UPI00369F5C31
MTEGGEFHDGLTKRIARFDREEAGALADKAEEERHQVLEDFPLERWDDLPLTRYALGPDVSALPGRSFCRLMEYGTDTFGSIRGGSAAKHIIFQHREGSWRIVPASLRDMEPHEAWLQVRGDFVTAFAAASKGAYDHIDELESLSYGQALTTKALAVYFPDEFLPIFSSSHLRYFTSLLGGRPHQFSSGVRAWRANRELLGLVRRTPAFEGWRPHEVMQYLYAFHDPRPSDRVVWKIAPGERAALWDDCLENRRIRVGWDEVGSLVEFESDRELKDALDKYFPYSTGGNLRLARQLLAFRDLEPGDLLVANRGKSEVLAVGTVMGGYSFDSELESHRHTVGVEWDTSFAQLFDSPRHAWQQTLVKVPATLMREIRLGRRTPAPPPFAPGPSAKAKTAFLPSYSDATVSDADLPEAVRTVRALLNHKGQVVLQGPPGTGKTRLALSVALTMAGRGDLVEAAPEPRAAALAELSSVPEGVKAARLTTVTFHPSYGYEDFVEGFKPDTAASGAGLHLKLTDGLFLRVCEEARQAPDTTFLIIVDEINRGDLPRILGEMITLLELDKRGSVSVTLPTSGRQRTVPPNVRLIGTMNSADRSVGHMDAAIRRRFAFVDVPPDLDALDGEVEGLGLAEFLEGLNTRLEARFGPDHLIGQAFLLSGDRPLVTAEQLSHAFHHEIVPSVTAFCLGRPELLQSVLGTLVDDGTGRVIQTNPQDLPSILAKEFVSAEAAGKEAAGDSTADAWGGE